MDEKPDKPVGPLLFVANFIRTNRGGAIAVLFVVLVWLALLWTIFAYFLALTG